MRKSLLILFALLGFIPAASAAGPWLGAATNGLADYTATYSAGTTTTFGNESQSIRIAGKWGIPYVTLNGEVGGLSPDGRTLVLAQADVLHNGGELSRRTQFKVLSTNTLRVRETVTLNGDYGFDTLSQHARTLYLIQHVSQESLFRYRVRAYDLAKHRLVSRVIADKRQQSWLMEGYPVARTQTTNGHWVYTLYSNANNYPFVHALDTVHRTAVCIGVPWDWTSDQKAINGATLTVKGGKLLISDRFQLDRASFKVTKAA